MGGSRGSRTRRARQPAGLPDAGAVPRAGAAQLLPRGGPHARHLPEAARGAALPQLRDGGGPPPPRARPHAACSVAAVYQPCGGAEGRAHQPGQPPARAGFQPPRAGMRRAARPPSALVQPLPACLCCRTTSSTRSSPGTGSRSAQQTSSTAGGSLPTAWQVGGPRLPPGQQPAPPPSAGGTRSGPLCWAA
jgi:hypothetical protein